MFLDIIYDKLYGLIQNCRNKSPLYRYTNENVFKCFLREIMQECKCDDNCFDRQLERIDFSDLCDKWITNEYYDEVSYLGCYTPVFSFTNIYSSNDQYGFEDDLLSNSEDKDYIKSKYFNAAIKFNTLNLTDDIEKKIKSFNKMRCATMEVREFCQKDVDCEKEFFDRSSFIDFTIPKQHLNKFTRNRKNPLVPSLVWKYTIDMTKTNRSQYDTNTIIPEIELPITFKPKVYIVSYPTKSTKVKFHNNTTKAPLFKSSTVFTTPRNFRNFNTTTRPTILYRTTPRNFRNYNTTTTTSTILYNTTPRNFRNYNTTTTSTILYNTTPRNFSSINNLTDTPINYDNNTYQSDYFDISVLIFIVIAVLFNIIAANSTWKSKKFHLSIGLVITIFTCLVLIGSIKFF